MTTARQHQAAVELLRGHRAVMWREYERHRQQGHDAHDPFLMGKAQAFYEVANIVQALIYTLERPEQVKNRRLEVVE